MLSGIIFLSLLRKVRQKSFIYIRIIKTISRKIIGLFIKALKIFPFRSALIHLVAPHPGQRYPVDAYRKHGMRSIFENFIYILHIIRNIEIQINGRSITNIFLFRFITLSV